MGEAGAGSQSWGSLSLELVFKLQEDPPQLPKV